METLSNTRFRLRFSLILKGEVDSIECTFVIDMLLTLKKKIKKRKKAGKSKALKLGYLIICGFSKIREFYGRFRCARNKEEIFFRS